MVECPRDYSLEITIYTVWLFIVAMEAMALIEIDDKHDDLPINMVMFHSYVKEAKGI